MIAILVHLVLFLCIIFKLSKVCDEIESVITTLKQIQSQMDLKNYIKLHETIEKLEGDLGVAIKFR